MKAEIYALADPLSHRIRYVGGWRHHSSIGKDGAMIHREYPAEVTAWIDSLCPPYEPIPVNLETYRYDDEKSREENESAVIALEQKWIGWFADSPLLGLETTPSISSPYAHKIKAGFYGWTVIEGQRRKSYVQFVGPHDDVFGNVVSPGRLVVNLFGTGKAQYDIPVESFTPDPEALYWEGHCPSPEEREAELVKLRQFMIEG